MGREGEKLDAGESHTGTSEAKWKAGNVAQVLVAVVAEEHGHKQLFSHERRKVLS